MALMIKESLRPHISMAALTGLSKMSVEEQAMFQAEFEKKMRSTGAMLCLAILFPIQLFFFGKTGLGILFLLTSGGCLVWWIIEIFLTPKRTREYNQDIATELLTNFKVMNN